ncbi:MAG TPA: ATP-binding protein [Vicinamibacteria bacterium]|nr:ATP-binding protein [Vicinamibacteria bacterium]
MTTEFRVSTQAPGPGLDALEDALRAAGLPDEPVLELRLVAEELLVNVAEHGHDDGAEHWVRVELDLTEDQATLRFVDDGRPFDPLAAPAPDLAGPVGERAVGGLGVHLVRSLVDHAEYARVEARNVVTVRKRVGPPPDDVA